MSLSFLEGVRDEHHRVQRSPSDGGKHNLKSLGAKGGIWSITLRFLAEISTLVPCLRMRSMVCIKQRGMRLWFLARIVACSNDTVRVHLCIPVAHMVI